MALTTVSTNNKLVKFSRQIMREYIRANLFSPYMGSGMTSIIRTINELKDGGEQMNIPLVGRLNAVGVGTGTLVGNEEKIDEYGFRLWIDWARNAVVTNKAELQKESAPIWDQARDLLSDWGTELQRDEIIIALHALPSTTAPAGLGTAAGDRINGIRYSVASAAQKNAWHDANSDRVLYGNATSNFVASDHAASLANIDSTNDKSTAANLDLAKSLAKRASPRIRPWKTEDGREYFVDFVNHAQFRDYRNDAVIAAANKDARAREGSGMDRNPIFQDGDLLWNGIIIREIPEMYDLTFVNNAGASTIDVAPQFLCGQSAVGFAWGQLARGTTRKEDDYEFLKGLGVEMAYGIGKLAKVRVGETALVDWGVFTHYTAAVA